LVAQVAGYFCEQPLCLQRVGDEVLDFLYPNREIGTRVESIELRQGVALCLRRFYVLMTQMVRGAWVTHIRKLNGAVLGTTADLGEFPLRQRAADLSGVRPVLIELQNSR